MVMNQDNSQTGMLKKLVFLIDYPIGPHWLKYIDLPNVTSKYDVTFIEIAISSNQIRAFSLRNPETKGNYEVIRVNDFGQLFQSTIRIRQATVVDITVSNLLMYMVINKIMGYFECKRVRILVNTVPTAKIGEKYLRNRIKELTGCNDLLMKSLRKILYIIRNKMRVFVYFDFYAIGGFFPQNLIDTQYGKLIYTVGFDFLNFRSANSDSPSDGEYALFIEENFVNDTDFILTGSSQSADPGLYFPSLTRFLQAVSNKFGIPIKIAPHPKTDVAELSKQLGSFEILNCTTAEAVKGAKFVMTHSSTAISYALLAQKPIIFFVCDGLNARVHAFQMAQLEMLELPVLSLEELCSSAPISLSQFMASTERAKIYIDSHVAHPRSSTFSFLEIVDQATNC